MKKILTIWILGVALSVSGCFLNDGPPENLFSTSGAKQAPEAQVDLPPPEAEVEAEDEEIETETEVDEGTTAEDAEGPEAAAAPAAPTPAPPPSPAPLPPAMTGTFTAASCTRPGSDVTLTWDITGADRISIQSIGYPTISRNCTAGHCAGSTTVRILSDSTFALRGMKGSYYVGNRKLVIQSEPLQYQTHFDSIFDATSHDIAVLNDADLWDGKNFLALPTGLFLASGSDLDPLQGDGLPGVAFNAVTVDHDNPEVVYAAAAGHLYESIDAGDHWDTIHMEEAANLLSVAAWDGHFVVGSEHGLYQGDVGGNVFYVADLGPVKILKTFARGEGFFALTETGVSWSADGDEWQQKLALNTSSTSAAYFEKVGEKVYLIASPSAYQWNTESHSFTSFGPAGSSVKAVGEKSGIGRMIVANGAIKLRRNGSSNWEEVSRSGPLPTLRGVYQQENGANLVWGFERQGGADRHRLYEWKLEEVPLSCAGN